MIANFKFSAAAGTTCEVCFEPLGTSFTLSGGQSIYLRGPAERLAAVEVVYWPNGLGVWVPHPRRRLRDRRRRGQRARPALAGLDSGKPPVGV
jgi:hypothetical protein